MNTHKPQPPKHVPVSTAIKAGATRQPSPPINPRGGSAS